MLNATDQMLSAYETKLMYKIRILFDPNLPKLNLIVNLCEREFRSIDRKQLLELWNFCKEPLFPEPKDKLQCKNFVL